VSVEPPHHRYPGEEKKTRTKKPENQERVRLDDGGKKFYVG